ncbi:MAG: DUF222 domain-containing protein [bacterium]
MNDTAMLPPYQPLSVSQHDTLNLKAEIIDLYASIQHASYQLIKLIALFDGEGHCWEEEFKTTAAWLGYYLGIGPNAAREKVRVARALVDLPVTDAAFCQGRLSYSKVRASSLCKHELWQTLPR